MKAKQRKGGGLCIFIYNSLNFMLREDLDKNNRNVESLSLEINNKKSNKSIASAIYRPPD